MQTGIELGTIRKNYPQDWRAYNAAQTSEKEQFLKLLDMLCSGLEEPKQTKGRPRLPIHDAIFSICYKIYSTVSARRFMSDLRDAQAKGYIQRTPHFNSIFKYLENEAISSVLQELIVKSSLPLVGIEKDFAADSSGFSTGRFCRWFEHKYGKKEKRKWAKLHLMCGVKTNIVTAVEILGQHTHDAVVFPDLIDQTAANFKISEVSADRAYPSLYAYSLIEGYGATPFIPFKTNHKKNDGLWAKMYHLFHYHQEEFMAHYHKRSNVETTFSMIKAKFGDYVRSKTEVAMKNEVYAKVLCHNICVLIQEMHELGIEPVFQKPNLS